MSLSTRPIISSNFLKPTLTKTQTLFSFTHIQKEAGFENIKVYYRDYALVFESINEVLGWWSSAGLIPFLEQLPERERKYFKYAFAMNFENNRTDKDIEFNFRRLFAFGEK